MLNELVTPGYCVLFNPTNRALMLYRLYYWNKMIDLIETIVFALRKKNSQISTLHVVHHVLVIWMNYLYLVRQAGK